LACKTKDWSPGRTRLELTPIVAFGSVYGSIGAPQEIKPKTGNSIKDAAIFSVSFSSLLKTSIPRTAPLYLLIKPFFSRTDKCSWTVAKEESPKCWAISVKVGA